MQITVLGKSPAWQDSGGACSGYLVQEGPTRVLIDCGNGVFAKLRERIDYMDVDAIVISHMHADHFFDLIPYSYALLFSPLRHDNRTPPQPRDDRPVLHVPAGAGAMLDKICGTFHNEPLIEHAFELREYEPGASIELGELVVDLRTVPHWLPTCAVSVTSAESGGRAVYGADCGPSEELVEFARDCDLVMLEATLPEPEMSEPRGHLTAGEAGVHARLAGARRLVVTHFSDEMDLSQARVDAEDGFGGAVTMAAEGDVYEV